MTNGHLSLVGPPIQSWERNVMRIRMILNFIPNHWNIFILVVSVILSIWLWGMWVGHFDLTIFLRDSHLRSCMWLMLIQGQKMRLLASNQGNQWNFIKIFNSWYFNRDKTNKWSRKVKKILSKLTKNGMM